MRDAKAQSFDFRIDSKKLSILEKNGRSFRDLIETKQ